MNSNKTTRKQLIDKITHVSLANKSPEQRHEAEANTLTLAFCSESELHEIWEKLNDEKIQILKDFRKEHTWTKTDAAEVMGYVSSRSWGDYESGRTPVPGQLLRHIEHYKALHKLIYVNGNTGD